MNSDGDGGKCKASELMQSTNDKSEHNRQHSYAPEMHPCPTCGVQMLAGRLHGIEFCRSALSGSRGPEAWEPDYRYDQTGYDDLYNSGPQWACVDCFFLANSEADLGNHKCPSNDAMGTFVHSLPDVEIGLPTGEASNEEMARVLLGNDPFTDESFGAAYTPDDELKTGKLLVSAEAFEAIADAISNTPEPSQNLLELTQDRRTRWNVDPSEAIFIGTKEESEKARGKEQEDE